MTPNLFSYQDYETAAARRAAAGTSTTSYSRPATGLRGAIAYTDKIYARLSMGGKTVAEVTRDRITNYTALLAILRAMVPACRGLARLTVRNMTQGWTRERPLMLYPDPAYAAAASRRCIPSEHH